MSPPLPLISLLMKRHSKQRPLERLLWQTLTWSGCSNFPATKSHSDCLGTELAQPKANRPAAWATRPLKYVKPTEIILSHDPEFVNVCQSMSINSFAIICFMLWLHDLHFMLALSSWVHGPAPLVPKSCTARTLNDAAEMVLS